MYTILSSVFEARSLLLEFALSRSCLIVDECDAQWGVIFSLLLIKYSENTICLLVDYLLPMLLEKYLCHYYHTVLLASVAQHFEGSICHYYNTLNISGDSG